MPPKKRAHSRHTNTQRPSKRTRSSDLSEVPPEAVIAPQHHRTSQNLISVDLQALSASIAATVSQAVQDALGTAGARNNTQDPGPSTLLIPDSSPSAAPPMDPVEEEIAVISGPGIVPKKDPSEFRLIHHLSYPKGSSVNDYIPQEFSSVKYACINDAISVIKSLGAGCFMAKTDIKSAFRIIPVHPKDHCHGLKNKKKLKNDIMVNH